MVTLETQIEPRTDDTERYKIIIDELASLGIYECPSEIPDHWKVLEENSEFNDDSRMVRQGVDDVVATLKENKVYTFTEAQENKLSLAALLHDIGKSSSSKDPGYRLAVVKLFAVKNIDRNDTELEVLRAVENNFPNEVHTMISDLSNVQVAPGMKIRAFWDKHAFWTKEILDKFSVFNKETKTIAASHHIDRGINPYGIDENKIPNELKWSIFILIAIDKYQARIIRGEATHEEAIEYLRDDLKNYNDDPIVKQIIKTIDEIGRKRGGNFFPLNEIEKLRTKERKGL